MKLSMRKLAGICVAVTAVIGVGGAPSASSAAEPVTFTAPYEVASICYKIPGIMYSSYCPPEKFHPASSGVLVAGGGKKVSEVPNSWLPYVESMSAGADYVAPEGGQLTVVAKLAGVQAGVTTSSQVCLIFSLARTCAVDAASLTLTATTDVSYMETVRVVVQARTSYLGIAAATVESITVWLVPDEVVY